ncbi:MAG: class I SAM-dependent methyltransferase [Candidatus Thermoplasmatota archaeon]
MVNHSKAEKFNRHAEKSSCKALEIVKYLDINPGDIIADIGAGGGFFSYLFAKEVGDTGQVFAIDINADYLDYIKQSALRKGHHNIITILATPTSPALPALKFNLIFCRNVYHHLSNRSRYFCEVKKYLKPDGAIAIVEYTACTPRILHTLLGHYVKAECIEQEMNQAGFSLYSCQKIFSTQHLLIFKVTKQPPPNSPKN